MKKPVCEICGRADGKLGIDHNHKTEHLRGILCSTCNSALGLFRESGQLLYSAMLYLAKYQIQDQKESPTYARQQIKLIKETAKEAGIHYIELYFIHNQNEGKVK